jgi:hypothetical protein
MNPASRWSASRQPYPKPQQAKSNHSISPEWGLKHVFNSGIKTIPQPMVLLQYRIILIQLRLGLGIELGFAFVR